MKYRWNVNNEFCGVDYTDTEGTEKPVRILRKYEGAFWTGDEWIYEFERKWVKNPPTKFVNFKINRNCNANCPYCAIGNTKNANLITEDEAMETFFRAFRKAKKMCEEKGFDFIPQITGGEPTLMKYENQERILELLKEYKCWMLFTNGADTSSPFFKNGPVVVLHIIDWKDGSFLDKKYSSRIGFCIVVTKGELDFVEPVLKKYNSLELPNTLTIKPNVLDNGLGLSEEEISRLHKLTTKYCWQSAFNTWENLKERGGQSLAHEICKYQKHSTWVIDCQNTNECQPCCGQPCEMVSLENFTGERTASCDGCNVPEIDYLSDDILLKFFGENEVL